MTSVLFCLLGYATVIAGKKKMVNSIPGVTWWVTMKYPQIWETVNVRITWITILNGAAMMTMGLICLKSVFHF